MNTNFFSQIAQLDIAGDLQLTLSKGTGGNLVVSVLLQNEGCGDSAKALIPPLILKGSAGEMDNGFFERVTTPLQTASGLMDNMEAFLQQVEQAKKQSAMEKQKTEKQQKQTDSKAKKYTEAMAKADELEAAGKYREAWMKVPDVAEFPEKTDEIRKRKSGLSAKFAPDLFGE